MPGVEEMTVRLGRRTRRRVRWSIGGFTLVWGGLWGAFMVVALVRGTLGQALLPALFFLVIWLPVALLMALRTAGSTRVGPAGLRLRGMFTRGFIAWEEVVEIKDRFHRERGSGWWTVEARLASGGTRRLPGFYCEGKAPVAPWVPERDREFDDQLTEVRRRLSQWQSAQEPSGRS